MVRPGGKNYGDGARQQNRKFASQCGGVATSDDQSRLPSDVRNEKMNEVKEPAPGGGHPLLIEIRDMSEEQPDDLDKRQLRIDLLERTLNYCTEDYALVDATYAGLDSKAQATFGIAGLFVAGAVTLIGTLSAAKDPAWVAILLPGLTYALLVVSILCSVLALRAREVSTPLDSESVATMTYDIIDLDDRELNLEIYANWFRDQIAEWQRVTREIHAVNARRARWLVGAQLTLLIAITCGAFATFALTLT